jgi:Methyltransferase domain
MRRLDFTLPDFTRIMWVSDRARKTWQPILDLIIKAWLEIEWLSVVEGVRACCLIAVTPEQFVHKGGQWAEHGLNNLPLAVQGSSNYTYSATSTPVKPGKPIIFRIVVGKPHHVIEFKRAWDAGDDMSIGRLLGYPDCCMDFYRENWIQHGLVDTTWPMATKDLTLSGEQTAVEGSGPPEANILWRWMGARAVPHLPCSLSCDATVEFGRKMIQVGRKAGYAMEMDRLMEILSWPVEWSALHGIAVIKTPVLKVSTRTDATPCEYVVRREGTVYPSEGASGLNFPYSRSNRLRSPEPRNLDKRSSLSCDLRDYPAWYWTDNGFSNVEAMNEAHAPIVELASSLALETRGNVLDLGCGNGALLQKIFQKNPGIVPCGIDLSPKSIAHAGIILPDFSDNFKAADMFENHEALWADKYFSLAIVMPGRFLERDAESADRLRNLLRKNCRSLLLYAYGEWLERFGSLSKLAEKSGFTTLNTGPSVKADFAMVSKVE